jgi:hypothetical protein
MNAHSVAGCQLIVELRPTRARGPAATGQALNEGIFRVQFGGQLVPFAKWPIPLGSQVLPRLCETLRSLRGTLRWCALLTG